MYNKVASNMQISKVEKSDYLELIDVWESSVRETHDFLKVEDILTLKPMILEHYFDAVDLRCIKNNHNKILGFVGVAAQNIEMLFILPSEIGKGLGKELMHYAIANQRAYKVDVNEQNPNAVRFYQKLGFKIVGRSKLDGQGNPFPLLHMRLSKNS
jgi:putative acetyltransferase